MFPQGGIIRAGHQGSFRPGIGWLASTCATEVAELPVVPVALQGMGRARFRGRLELHVGAALAAPRLRSRAQYVAFSRRLESEVASLIGGEEGVDQHV